MFLEHLLYASYCSNTRTTTVSQWTKTPALMNFYSSWKRQTINKENKMGKGIVKNKMGKGIEGVRRTSLRRWHLSKDRKKARHQPAQYVREENQNTETLKSCKEAGMAGAEGAGGLQADWIGLPKSLLGLVLLLLVIRGVTERLWAWEWHGLTPDFSLATSQPFTPRNLLNMQVSLFLASLPQNPSKAFHMSP